MWIVLFISALFIGIFLTYTYHHNVSYAQWMIPPVPSPSMPPYASDCCNSGINSSSSISAPEISIWTDKLFDGNNVLKLKILDQYPLKMRGISYSVGNHSITTYLAKEHNNEYRALLKVLAPSTKVEVTAIDINNNYAKLVKEIKVEKGIDAFFSTITNSSFWNNLFFGDKKH